MNTSLDQQFLTHVKAAQAGDLKAFEVLVQRTSTLVNTLAITICRDADCAKDISQQVYVSVWRKLGQLQQPESFLPWLRQLTRHQALNAIRGRKIEPADVECEALVCESPTPDEFWDSAKLKNQLAKLVDSLPDSTREVFILYYREQESVSQVASLLELTEDTVKKRLQRGREKLKALITDDYRTLLTASMPLCVVSIGSLIGNSAPVAAATLNAGTSLGASSKLAGTSALKMGLGAMIGVSVGAGAQYFGLQPLINRTHNPAQKLKLQRLRNFGLAWSLTSGALFTASYLWTLGWFWPVVTYVLFVLGVVITTLSVWRIASEQGRCDRGLRYIGLWGGLLAGGSGLIAGLIQSGRLLL